jgi:hypothetical protein
MLGTVWGTLTPSRCVVCWVVSRQWCLQAHPRDPWGTQGAGCSRAPHLQQQQQQQTEEAVSQSMGSLLKGTGYTMATIVPSGTHAMSVANMARLATPRPFSEYTSTSTEARMTGQAASDHPRIITAPHRHAHRHSGPPGCTSRINTHGLHITCPLHIYVTICATLDLVQPSTHISIVITLIHRQHCQPTQPPTWLVLSWPFGPCLCEHTQHIPLGHRHEVLLIWVQFPRWG